MRCFRISVLLAVLTAGFLWIVPNAVSESMDADRIASLIVGSLKLRPGERVLIRFDPTYMPELVYPLRKKIREAKAVDAGALEYVEKMSELGTIPENDSDRQSVAVIQMKAFERILESVDVYIWLATSPDRDLYRSENDALRNWLQKGATRRQIHFHWRSGSVQPDGLPGEHSAALDEMYRTALEIDYDALSAAQERASAILRKGTVRVTTAAGTDLTFQIGNRPFNRQNGDASPDRAREARVLVDREIEFPAGVLRVAPLESTVQGTMVIPEARFKNSIVRDLRFEFENGRIVKMDAAENLLEAEAQLAEVGEVGKRFREFGLGFNPRLKPLEESKIIPYYGYGAGVVRLALGDNQEIGGVISGGYVRWFFFPDATVEVDGRRIVENGNLVEDSGE